MTLWIGQGDLFFQGLYEFFAFSDLCLEGVVAQQGSFPGFLGFLDEFFGLLDVLNEPLPLFFQQLAFLSKPKQGKKEQGQQEGFTAD